MPTYHKGRVAPANLEHIRKLSFLRHADILRALPVANQATWDSRTQNWIGPVKDQAQCGSCWDFSGTCVVEVANYKVGVLVPDGTQALSEEYTLSCCRNGGCGGDDNTTVLAWAKSTGLPRTSDYGPYNAGSGTPGKCTWKPSMNLFKITDWGFADSNGGQGVTKTQDIKNCIAYYGCVGAAIAADDAFMNNPPGTVFQGSGSTDIDHDIVLIGWDDSRGKVSGAMDPSLVGVKAASLTAWILRNSWGANSCREGAKEHRKVHKSVTWCDGGYCFIVEGANEVGTESVFGFVNSPTPTPVPPGPTPGPTPVAPSILFHLFFNAEESKGHDILITLPADVPAGEYDVSAHTTGRHRDGIPSVHARPHKKKKS